MKSQNSFLFLSIFIILYLFNLVFPAQSDDIIHHFSALNNDFFASYLGWNGRFGELLYTGFFAKYNDYIWLDILNAFIGTTFIFALFFLIFARFPKDKLDYLSFFLLCIMLVNMNFATIFLWYAGSFNYLWGMCFIVLFLIPYRLFWDNMSISSNKYKPMLTCLLIPLGICAGWSSEHIGATVSLLLVLSFGFAFYKKIKLPYWYYLGAMIFWIGWLILFFSPGSAKRAVIFAQTGSFIPLADFFHMSFIDQIIRINSTLNKYYSRGFAFFLLCFAFFYLFKQNIKLKNYKYFFILLATILALIFTRHISAIFVYILILYATLQLGKQDQKYYLFTLLFGIWILIGLATFQIGSLPWRGKFGSELILITLIILMFREFYLDSSRQHLIEKSIKVVLCLSIIFCFTNWSYRGYQWNQLSKEIQKQKSQGIENIIVSKKYFYSLYRTDWGEPGTDDQDWVNQAYAKHFQIKSFKVQ